MDSTSPFFSNAFSTYLCVITSDNYLVLTQRSQNVGSRPGEFCISATEALNFELDHDGEKPDIYLCATRGLKEELGITAYYKDINFLSFGVDTYLSHWALLGFVETEKSKAYIEQMRRQGTHDKWENRGIYFVPFNLDCVVEFVLSQESPWSPGALACIYHTLAFKFTREACDTYLGSVT